MFNKFDLFIQFLTSAFATSLFSRYYCPYLYSFKMPVAVDIVSYY